MSQKLFGRLTLFLLLIILAGYPIVASIRILFDIDGNAISIGYRFFYFLLALFLLIVKRTDSTVSPQLKWPLFALILFFFIYSIRIVYDLQVRFIPAYGEHGFSYFMTYAIAGCFIPCLAIQKSEYLRMNVKWINKSVFNFYLLSAVVVFLTIVLKRGIDQQILDSRFSFTGEENENILSGLLFSNLGSSLSIISVIKLLGTDKTARKILYFVSLILGVFILFLGASRTPFFNLLFTIIILIGLNFSKKRVSRLRPLFFIIFLPIIILLRSNDSSTNIQSLAIYQRMQALSEDNEASRPALWSSALGQFARNPLLGDKMFEEKVLKQYPHNIVVESLMSTGVVGAMLLFVFLFAVFKSFFSRFKDEDNYLMNFLFLNEFLFGMSSGAIYLSASFWVIAMFILVNPYIPQNKTIAIA